MDELGLWGAAAGDLEHVRGAVDAEGVVAGLEQRRRLDAAAAPEVDDEPAVDTRRAQQREQARRRLTGESP